MIVLALLMQIDATLTFGEAQRLPPAMVGERLLKGEQFRPIESFARFGAESQGPPGFVETRLFEPPVATSLGCTRQRWTVNFHAEEGKGLDSAVPYDRYRQTDIALPTPSGCASADYVYRNRDVPEAQGFAVLRQLERLRAGRKTFAITCSDDTASGLCKDKAGIPAALARLKPWNIVPDAHGFRVWLSATPGHTVTEVRFDSRKRSRIWIDRRFPAPF